MLAHEIDGEGPVVVLHPGLGFSRGYFRPLAASLRAHGRCVLVDPRPTASLAGMADDLIALLDDLGVGAALLYGHSVGANVVVEAALRAPARVGGLVLSSFSAAAALVAPFLEHVRRQATPEQAAVLERHERGGRPLADAAYRAAAGALWSRWSVHTPLSDEVAPLVDVDLGGPAWAAGWGTESAFRITGWLAGVDQRPRLRSLACPVTLLNARYDDYAAPSVPVCREEIERLTVVELTHSRHYAHLEEPARTAEAVVDALGWASVPATRAPVALRVDVARVELDGAPALEDGWTGYRVGLGAVELSIVEQFGAPLDDVIARVVAHVGADYDAAQVADAVRAFVGDLSRAGLLAEGLTTEEIERRQRVLRAAERALERADAVRAVVLDACARVPFHRERAQAAGTAPDDPAPLLRLPTMTKADVRANFPTRLVPDGLDVKRLLEEGALTLNATSGSTDERLQVLFDPKTGALPDGYDALWDLADDEVLDRGAIFTSPICAGFECHLGRSTQEERTRGVTLTLNSCDDPMAITDAEVRAIVGEMHAYRPRMIFVNPWYAVWLLRRMRALALELPPIAVVLSSYQYLTRRHRRLLEEGFRAKVFSYYGATDLGGALIGVECHRGRMHVREDHVHFELTHEKDGLGLVTVTTLASPQMPLLRYEVGDLARRAPPCPCGSDWATFVLEGRRKDVLYAVDGRTVTTRLVDDAVGDLDVDFWRLTQESAAAYRLEALPAPAWDRARVTARLRHLLGGAARIDVDEVRAFAPERSLKFRQTSSTLPLVW